MKRPRAGAWIHSKSHTESYLALELVGSQNKLPTIKVWISPETHSRMQLPTLTCPNVLTPPYFAGHWPCLFCSQHILARWNTSRSLLSRHYHRCCHWNKHVVGKSHDCKQPTFNPEGTPGDSSPEWNLHMSHVPILSTFPKCSFSGLPRDCSRSPSFAGGCHTWEEHLGRWHPPRSTSLWYRQVCDFTWYIMIWHACRHAYIHTDWTGTTYRDTDRHTDRHVRMYYLFTYLPAYPPTHTYLSTYLCAYLPTCTYQLVPTYLYLSTCTYLLVPTYRYLPTCTNLLVPTYLYLPACTYLLVPTYRYLPTCTYLPPSLPTYLILPT